MKTFEEKLQLFKNKLLEIYNSDSESILATHYLDRKKTFRINNLIDPNPNRALEMLRAEGIEYRELDIKGLYLVTNELIQLSRTQAFAKKLIYIQEASSFLPVLELDPQGEEKILDMCASPGSKTSLIQSITNNLAQVVAIEKSRNRFFTLKENLKVNGVMNVNVINFDANRLVFIKPEFTNYFDKILVDAPCTTESKINLNEEDSLREWKPSNARDISKLQRGLLNSAFKMLRKNGTLIYSTCTHSTEENEEVVNWFLKKNPNAKLMDVDLELDSLEQGVTETKNKKLNPEIIKSVRVIPDQEFTAFYLAKITKL